MYYYVMGFLVLANLVVAAVSLMIFRKMEQHGDTAMASFKLKPKKAINDFRVLLYAHALQTSIYILFIYAGIYELINLIEFGRKLSAVFGIMVLLVFFRWLRRF